MKSQLNRHIYTLNKPASWFGEMWREALPLGNGLTGALIPGAIADESIQLNRHNLWHCGVEGGEIPDISDVFRKMREYIDENDYVSANQDNIATALREKGYEARCECPYPFGWLEMKFVPEELFRHYKRGVNMQTGEAFVEFCIGEYAYQRRMFVSRKRDIAVLRMTAEKPFTTSFGFRLFSDAEASTLTENSISRVSKDGECAVHILFLGSYNSEIQGDRIVVTGHDYTVLICCSSHESPNMLEECANLSYENLLDEHVALHSALYDTVSIELANNESHEASNEKMLSEAYDEQASPALFERLWRFGRYLFISAANENGNPVPLYGLWHGGDGMPWSQYVANENVEMTYWHTMAGGLSYAIPPLLRYYTAKIEKFRECAHRIFGMRGIWISAYTTPNIASFCVPVVVIANWISCAGWLCRHFWDYYLYTGDEKLLREEILPFMYEAALFYRDYVVEDGDSIRIYPSISPENTPSNLPREGVPFGCMAVQNALLDFAVMKELFTHLLLGIEITGLYEEEAESFRALLDKIPPYSTNEDGAVKEWLHPDIADNYHHRHLSHIYPIFPGTEVTEKSNPVLFNAFKKAVKLRKLNSQSGWSLTHMANIYARMGEAEKAAECIDIMAKSVVMDSLMTLHNDWRGMGLTLLWGNEATVQLDAAFGAVNAIQEMLIRYEPGVLSILPSIPSRLRSGRVCGIRFPGGSVDITWNNSDYVNVTVNAERDLNEIDVFIKGEFRGTFSLLYGEKKNF